MHVCSTWPCKQRGLATFSAFIIIIIGEHDIKLGEGIKLEDNIELKENIKLEEDMEAAATHESSIILQPTPISNEDKIHVVLSFDHNRFVAVTNVINSLKKYSNNVVVHIITDDVPTLESLIKCCNISGIEVCILIQ